MLVEKRIPDSDTMTLSAMYIQSCLQPKLKLQPFIFKNDSPWDLSRQ